MAKPENIQFECVKVGTSQNKDGWILRLAIHPSDMNEAIALAPSGQRYMVVMVEMPESQQDLDNQEADRAITLAGIVCKEPDFWKYIGSIDDFATPTNEDQCTKALRQMLGIKTRSALRENTTARQGFMKMYHEYKEVIEAMGR